MLARVDVSVPLTCVDEILVGQAGVVHVMDSAGEYGGQSLKGREHRLDTGHGVNNNNGGGGSPRGPGCRAKRSLTGSRQPRGCCCDKELPGEVKRLRDE